MTEEKICKGCFISKPLNSDFYYKEKLCLDGYRGKCKECDKARKKIHYQNNKEKYKKAFQDFKLRNPDYYKKIKKPN